jgi:hypothetical protein
VEFEIVFHGVDVRFQSASRFKVRVSPSLVHCINTTLLAVTGHRGAIYNYSIERLNVKSLSICSFTLLKMKLISHS